MQSWLDILPSAERQRIREKFRISEAAYEKLRERVRGPEDLRREMAYNEVMAELKYELASEPRLRDALKLQVEKDLREGTEAVCDGITEEQREAILKGNFEVAVEAADSEKAPDQLVIRPEGNIAEAIPIKPSLTEQYIAQFIAV